MRGAAGCGVRGPRRASSSARACWACPSRRCAIAACLCQSSSSCCSRSCRVSARRACVALLAASCASRAVRCAARRASASARRLRCSASYSRICSSHRCASCSSCSLRCSSSSRNLLLACARRTSCRTAFSCSSRALAASASRFLLSSSCARRSVSISHCAIFSSRERCSRDICRSNTDTRALEGRALDGREGAAAVAAAAEAGRRRLAEAGRDFTALCSSASLSSSYLLRTRATSWRRRRSSCCSRSRTTSSGSQCTSGPCSLSNSASGLVPMCLQASMNVGDFGLRGLPTARAVDGGLSRARSRRSAATRAAAVLFLMVRKSTLSTGFRTICLLRWGVALVVHVAERTELLNLKPLYYMPLY